MSGSVKNALFNLVSKSAPQIVLMSEETGAYRKIAASGYMIGQEKTRFESDTMCARTHVCK